MTIQSLFVTGTDTEIGKTLVTAMLALSLQARGIDVGIMKPFASGCEMRDGALRSEDARWLQEMTGSEDERELINPARWEEPLTPLMAARRAGDGSDYWARSLEAYAALRARHEVMIVEGVGGLLAPIAEQDGKILTNADWMSAVGLPAVLVSRRTLGTINHTLSALEILRERKIACQGIIFCDAQRVDENDVAAQTSPQLIGEISGCEILGAVPHLGDLSRETLQAAVAELSFFAEE